MNVAIWTGRDAGLRDEPAAGHHSTHFPAVRLCRPGRQHHAGVVVVAQGAAGDGDERNDLGRVALLRLAAAVVNEPGVQDGHR